MTDQPCPTAARRGDVMVDDPIHQWFGLTYASYLTLPRSVLQSMPKDWQCQLVQLLQQLHDACEKAKIVVYGGEVRIRGTNGKYVQDPLCDYRRGRRNVFKELQPCPKCDGWRYTIKATSDGDAKMPCDCTRADPALVSHETSSAIVNAGSVSETIDNAQQGETGLPATEQDQQVIAHQGAREGNIRFSAWDDMRDEGMRHLAYVTALEQLAAKDAALSLVKKNNVALLRNLDIQEAEIESLHGQALSDQTQYVEAQAQIDRLTSECLVRRREIGEADTLIRQLTDALRDYVKNYDGFLDGTGRPCPTLKQARKAIAAAETMMGEKENG